MRPDLKKPIVRASAKNNSKILALEYHDIRERLIEEFALRSCYERDLVMPSGRIVNHDIDMSASLLNSEVGLLASLAILHNLQDEVECVGGSDERSALLAPALSQVAFLRGRDLDSFLVRSEPKQINNMKWLDGHLPAQSRVCIVHDLVVDGVQLIKTIRRLKEEVNVEIVQAIAVVDRADGSRERLRDIGIDFTAICTMDEVLRRYQQHRKPRY
jgi:orotate phosphoribosyltransferase